KSATERLRRCAISFARRLRVGAQCQAWIRVTEPRLGGLEIDAPCDERRRVRSPQVVKREPAELRVLDRREPRAPSPTLVAQWSTLRADEQQSVGVSAREATPGHMTREHDCESRRHWERSTPRLR